MEMHQVRYFLAAASERNFTKAADKCGVSPPSLLRAVKLLELEFGGPLFNRERSNTHLSELGRIALPHLQQLLQEATDAKKKAKEFLSLKEVTLSVGMMCTIVPSEFIAMLSEFRRRHPNVALKIVDGNATTLEKALITGDLEIAFYCLPDREPHERTHALPLFKERMMIAVAAKHPLAKRKTIKGQELNGEPYLDRINCEFTGYADNEFSKRQIDGPTIYQSERDDWVLAMVATGIGYGFMPQSTAKYPGVVARPLVEPEFWRTVNLVTVRGRPHSPAVGAFVREVMRTKWLGKVPLAVSNTKALLKTEPLAE